MATARWRFVVRESGPGWYYWELQDTTGQMVVLSRVARGKDGVLEDIKLFRQEAPIALLNAEVPEFPSATEPSNNRPS